MKDYKKLWYQLKAILDNEETIHSKRTINTMEKLEQIQPIAVFTKPIPPGVIVDEIKGIRKFFKGK